jgi:hypothetical protein
MMPLADFAFCCPCRPMNCRRPEKNKHHRQCSHKVTSRNAAGSSRASSDGVNGAETAGDILDIRDSREHEITLNFQMLSMLLTILTVSSNLNGLNPENAIVETYDLDFLQFAKRYGSP